MKPLFSALTLCIALGLTLPAKADSEIGAISAAVPALLSLTAIASAGELQNGGPAALLSASGALVVASVEVVGDATVWVLERASDGARISLRTSGRLAEGSAKAVGTTVVVTVLATGLLLSTALDVIALIPNELGRALMHNEKVSR
jgi:hypothetical protein